MLVVAELIGFPDVETLILSVINPELATRLPGVQGYTKVPLTRPNEFVRVIRFGGPSETIISENALIIIEAWAQSETRAVTILNMVRAILHAQDGSIFGVTEISGPNNLPDPLTSQIRYTQNLGVRVRGTVIA